VTRHTFAITELGQLAMYKLSPILDTGSFYTSITSDYIGVEVRGGGEPQSGTVFNLYKLNTI